MPILASDAEEVDYAPLYDEIAPRIDAAISFLRDKGIKDIVLIGHSQGSTMGAYYLSKHSTGIRAFVAIGMPGASSKDKMNNLLSLKTIHIPVLDLYGSEDLENVLSSDKDRIDTAKAAGNKHYTQKKIAGANHFFDGKNNELLETVADWLDNLTD